MVHVAFVYHCSHCTVSVGKCWDQCQDGTVLNPSLEDHLVSARVEGSEWTREEQVPTGSPGNRAFWDREEDHCLLS